MRALTQYASHSHAPSAEVTKRRVTTFDGRVRGMGTATLTDTVYVYLYGQRRDVHANSQGT